MTKTTKTTASKATAAKTETKTDATRNLFGALSLTGKKTVEGVFAFDKALFGIAKSAVTSYVDHGKAIAGAKSISDVVDIQAAYAHSAIETTAANSRELLDLAKTKTEEAYAPVKEAIADLKSDKKAA